MTEDIRAWLENLGLAQYGETFADNDIGSDILADLTEDHLEKMGVSIGNRLRLLKAISAETANAADALAPATTPVAAASPLGSRGRFSGEIAAPKNWRSAAPPLVAKRTRGIMPMTIWSKPHRT